jgi:glycosyltransferase involved in cell wall biosynthesis
MQHFLPHNRVLWVNTIGMRLPRFTLYDCRRAMGKLKSWVSKSERVDLPEGLHVISPVMIPFNPIAAVRSFNSRSVISCVRKSMRELGMQNPILLASLPMASDYVGKVGESMVVYYCVDDFANWADMNAGSMVLAMEDALLSQADMVVAVSEHLLRTRLARKGLTRLLTHGVDVDHFRQVRIDPRPAELFASAPRPVIGFFGLLDNRMDWALVQAILEMRPDWSLVFIGNAQVSLDRFNAFENFIHVPAVPYADLPRYAAWFDAAMLPYVVDQTTAGINPLKLKEYLALGLPVVTTALPGVLEFGDCLHVAEGPCAFVEALVTALGQGRSEVGLARLKGESWSEKADLLSSWIEEELAQGKLLRAAS